MDLINTIVEYSTEVISNGGILFGMLLIMIESFIPVLPLSVFIALNTHTFGLLPGILMSWVSTCIGCYISYLIFYYVSNNIIYKYVSKKVRNKIETANMQDLFEEIKVFWIPTISSKETIKKAQGKDYKIKEENLKELGNTRSLIEHKN